MDQELAVLRGVGPGLSAKFKQLGLKTLGDLVRYWPRRYDDFSQIMPISRLQPGPVTIKAKIIDVRGRYVRRGLHITEASAQDDSTLVRLVWFNQPYRATSLKSGQDYFIAGNYELSRQRFGLVNPAVELAADLPLNTARIVPIYKETKGLNSRQIRASVADALAALGPQPETLPEWLVKRQKLVPYNQALVAIHFPESAEQLAAARWRFAFEEVFELSLASQYARLENQRQKALPVPFDLNLAKQFVAELPYDLTAGQRRAVWQIYQDIALDVPMNRLLEGDVGSGKTLVAAMAGLMALAAGSQVVLMAPTELLARQHADSLRRLLEPHGQASQVCLLVGSMSAAQKTAARRAIKAGLAGFIVGTHALIQESVDMHKLALIVIDEQHRFGVEQRKKLLLKAGHMPHVLSMTATPIPRSLALTLYGEMDITVLPEKPPGRQPVVTELVPPSSQPRLYEHLQTELAAGRQLFVVCPLVNESEVLEANSAEATYQRLKKGPLKKWRLGLLHGKLRAVDKQFVMADFVEHKLDVLVATTVIEVGVDVPNATVMLIESPERFGLAQLHQLRGRVGRGQHPGSCYLLLSDAKPPSRRLKALAASSDGFKLSELDLEIRGPGAIYGSLQHGALDLRIAQLGDTAMIANAQSAAKEFVSRNEPLLKYPMLAKHLQRLQTVTNLN